MQCRVTGEASVSFIVRMSMMRKRDPCDIVGAAGALLMLQDLDLTKSRI